MRVGKLIRLARGNLVRELGALAVSGIALWRALPGMITKEQASVRGDDPFDPSTAPRSSSIAV